MLSDKLQGMAAYFEDRSLTLLILPPLATASMARLLQKFAAEAATLETGRNLPEGVIDLAAALHKSGVRRGVVPNPKGGGDAA